MQASQLAERTARITFLKNKLADNYNDLREHTNESAKYKKDKIAAQEGIYRELITLGELKVPVSKLAALIIKDCRENGIDGEQISDSWVYANTSDDCKEEQETQIRTQLKGVDIVSRSSSGTLTYNNLPPVEQLKKADNGILDDTHTELVDTEKDLAAKLRLIRDKKEEVEKLGEERKLTFSKGNPRDPNSTPKPEGRVTKMSEAFAYGKALFEHLEAKSEEFPSTVEEEEYHAQSVYQLLSIFAPMADEKWSADYVSPQGHLQMQKYNQIHGKHAAAVKFGITTASGEYRPMTREQVGDKFEEIVDKTTELYNAIPGVVGIHDWYNKRVRPHIGDRKLGFVNPNWS